MVAARKYDFDGEQRTIAEICALVPALGRSAVRARLAAGMTTRTQLLNFDPVRAMRAGGRRGRAACGMKLSWSNPNERADR